MGGYDPRFLLRIRRSHVRVVLGAPLLIAFVAVCSALLRISAAVASLGRHSSSRAGRTIPPVGRSAAPVTHQGQRNLRSARLRSSSRAGRIKLISIERVAAGCSSSTPARQGQGQNQRGDHVVVARSREFPREIVDLRLDVTPSCSGLPSSCPLRASATRAPTPRRKTLDEPLRIRAVVSWISCPPPTGTLPADSLSASVSRSGTRA